MGNWVRKWVRRFRRRPAEPMPAEHVRTNGKSKGARFEELVRYMACMGMFTQNIPMMMGNPEEQERNNRRR